MSNGLQMYGQLLVLGKLTYPQSNPGQKAYFLPVLSVQHHGHLDMSVIIQKFN